MLDFLDNDIVVIILNIVFLIFIIYDYKKYKQTKQKMLLLNIAITLGFAIWVMIPFYNKYVTWDEIHTQELRLECSGADISLCDCVTDATVKNYSLEDYLIEDHNSTDFKSFLKEEKKGCLED